MLTPDWIDQKSIDHLYHNLSVMNTHHYIALKRIQELLIGLLVLISGVKTCTSLQNKCECVKILSLWQQYLYSFKHIAEC